MSYVNEFSPTRLLIKKKKVMMVSTSKDLLAYVSILIDLLGKQAIINLFPNKI